MAFSKEEVVEEEEVEEDERRRAESGVLVLQGTPSSSLLLPFLPPHLQWESILEKGRVAVAPVRINIIYVINIKITLLCFLSGSGPRQLKGPAPMDGCFRPCFLSAPPSLAIYRDHNLLWWVFKVLFCQGQSGLSNKWSRWSAGGGGLAPATSLLFFSGSGTRGQIHIWKVLHQLLLSLTLERMVKEEGGRRRCKEREKE